MSAQIGPPAPEETAPYYHRYIERVAGPDPVEAMEAQLPKTLALLSGISEERSLYRYEPGKWSIRQVLNHLNDAERLFAFRAFWFARGFDTPLPSFDQEIGAAGADADRFSWASHLEDFRAVRTATLTFFRNLPEASWMRSGIASGYPFTVRSIAYILAGHLEHHLATLRERYLAE